MCLEIYHPEMPVHIHYEQEILQFTSESRFIGRYAFLIRNSGSQPIDMFWVLYPRSLYDAPVNGRVPAQVPRDITKELGPAGNPYFDKPGGETLTLHQPDPNRPQFNRPPLTGLWLPNEKATWQLPIGFDDDCASLMRHAGFTCWQLDLRDRPLKPQEARWFWWELTISDVGTPLGRTAIGARLMMYQLASPIDVRRTCVEMIEAGLRTGEFAGDFFTAGVCRKVIDALGLQFGRRVDIEYYELAVWPGDPARQVVVSWQMDRDLRLRSGSPRLGTGMYGEPNGQPIFEWKSGSLLKPDHAWKDEGFILHLTLAY